MDDKLKYLTKLPLLYIKVLDEMFGTKYPNLTDVLKANE